MFNFVCHKKVDTRDEFSHARGYAEPSRNDRRDEIRCMTRKSIALYIARNWIICVLKLHTRLYTKMVLKYATDFFMRRPEARAYKMAEGR